MEMNSNCFLKKSSSIHFLKILFQTIFLGYKIASSNKCMFVHEVKGFPLHFINFAFQFHDQLAGRKWEKSQIQKHFSLAFPVLCMLEDFVSRFQDGLVSVMWRPYCQDTEHHTEHSWFLMQFSELQFCLYDYKLLVVIINYWVCL